MVTLFLFIKLFNIVSYKFTVRTAFCALCTLYCMINETGNK